MAYVKLFGSILASTIWQEPSATRIVWITLLALADRDGVVSASVPGLAHLAGVEREDCERALKCLLSADPDSRTTDHEGRRIATVDGGWLLLNYEVYRDRASLEDKRAKDAARQKRKYDRDKKASRIPHAASRNITKPRLSSHLTSEESHSEENTADAVSGPSSEPRKQKQTLTGIRAERFAEWWDRFDYKTARGAAERAFLKVPQEILEDDKFRWPMFLGRTRNYVEATPDKKTRKHPATWLNAQGWEDEEPPHHQDPEPERKRR